MEEDDDDDEDYDDDREEVTITRRKHKGIGSTKGQHRNGTTKFLFVRCKIYGCRRS